jgi:hypothetical protein
MMNLRWFLPVLFLTLAPPAFAQPPQPAPPKEYDVQLRYRLQASRNDRIPQFDALVKYLESVGFQKDAGPTDERENALYDRMTGRIASGNVRELLKASAVRSLLLFPAGHQLPEDLDQPVKVSLQLSAGRALEPQRVLFEQVRDQLRDIGFKEPIVYDQRGYTRLLGTVPTSAVGDLFKDIRTRPDGWLAPLKPLNDLPLPLRDLNAAIRIAEVVPEPEGVPPIKAVAPREVPKPEEPAAKLSADLLALLGKEEKERRLEVVLFRVPDPNTPWQAPLLTVIPNRNIEGHIGQIVTIRATPEQGLALAASPAVVAVRLPRSSVAGVPLVTPAKDSNRAVLETSGLALLHNRGQRGQGVRVAVIGADFRGWTTLRGKQLPRSTRMIDLTAERNILLLPELDAEEKGVGHGTQCAVAVAVAAPAAEITLIRVDPAAYYQFDTIARNLNGERFLSDSLLRRRDDFDAEHERIDSEWRDVLRDRRRLLENPESADELEPQAIKRRKEREAHEARVAKLKDEEKSYGDSLLRFQKLLSDLRDLPKVQVVVSTLAWPDGHPVDGSSSLSRYLDSRPFRSTWWLQASGDLRDQTWTGLFRDGDNNGVMEFAPAATPLKAQRWSPEINFLAWQPNAGARALELPAKATLRLSVQWREAHDPDYFRAGEDTYRVPLADVRLVLLRQRDPSGTRVGADEMEVVAHSVGVPLRIRNEAESSTYEQTLEFTVEDAGRYALRVEGSAPQGNKPPGSGVLPAQQRSGELRLRILLDVSDAASRAAGRVVFLDYPTGSGDIAMPGDALRTLTIGAADAYALPRSYTSTGPAMNLDLLLKPNVLGFDGLELATPGEAIHGSSVAASFAGGLAATLLSNGAPPSSLRSALPGQKDSALLAPAKWPLYQPPPRKPFAQ